MLAVVEIVAELEAVGPEHPSAAALLLGLRLAVEPVFALSAARERGRTSADFDLVPASFAAAAVGPGQTVADLPAAEEELGAS